MNTAADIAPITDMRDRPNEILARLMQGPVILTEHGRSAAVLLSMEEWEAIKAQLSSLQDPQILRSLYAEFDAEEKLLAETGLSHYAETITREEDAILTRMAWSNVGVHSRRRE